MDFAPMLFAGCNSASMVRIHTRVLPMVYLLLGYDDCSFFSYSNRQCVVTFTVQSKDYKNIIYAGTYVLARDSNACRTPTVWYFGD